MDRKWVPGYGLPIPASLGGIVRYGGYVDCYTGYPGTILDHKVHTKFTLFTMNNFKAIDKTRSLIVRTKCKTFTKL